MVVAVVVGQVVVVVIVVVAEDRETGIGRHSMQQIRQSTLPHIPKYILDLPHQHFYD